MVTRLLLLRFACTTREPVDVGFNNVVKKKKEKQNKIKKKTSNFARSAISLFDQIMSISRLYIVLVFGQGQIGRTRELMYLTARSEGSPRATDISREKK